MNVMAIVVNFNLCFFGGGGSTMIYLITKMVFVTTM